MITQLESEYLSRLDGRYFNSRLRNTKLRIHKLIRSKIKKTRSRVLAWHRRQYYFSTACADLRKSISRNEDIFITMMLIAAIIGYSYAVAASEIFYMFFLTAYTFSETSGVNMILVSLFTLVVATVMIAWLAAFVLNTLSIAIMHGANNKLNRSVRKTVRTGLAYTTKTTAAWAIVLLSVARPLVFAGAASLLSIVLALKSDLYIWFVIAAVSAVLGLIIAIRNLLRNSLLPYVALFEEKLSYVGCAERSANLTKRKGKIFLSVIYLGLLSTFGVSFVITWLLEDIIGLHQGVTFGFLAIIILMFSNGLMVQFYRKRRLARSR